MKPTILAISHAAVLAVGVALGIYVLPILVEPAGLSAAAISEQAKLAKFSGAFKRDLPGSDFLHWGEGVVYVSPDQITLNGRVAPGPDYKLYLSPSFVDTNESFERLKPMMVRVGDVRTFRNFQIKLPAGVEPERFTTVVIWCETFHQFISSAKYREL